MREIKFRGKDTITGEWLYGIYIPASCTKLGYHSIIDSRHRREVDPDTVGQYTGVCDSNENDIYEGDIISFLFNRKRHHGVIKFADGRYWVKSRLNMRRDDLFQVMIFNDINVVGNIHDNPELAEETK